jgi:TonB family protein
MKTRIAAFIVTAIALSGCSTVDHSSQNTPKEGATAVLTAMTSDRVDQRAILLVLPNPEYPAELKKAGIIGSAVISFIVETDGRTSELAVKTATHPEFGAAALAAIHRARFRPASIGGKPVRVRMEMPINIPMQ